MRRFLCWFIFCSLWMTSCRKDAADSAPMLVQNISIDGNSCQINYMYDAQNRVTSVVQCDTSEAYTYYTDSIVYLRTVKGAFFYKYTYTLNTTGIATGYTKTASDGSVTSYMITYDAYENRVKVQDITHANTSITYVIQNNDAVYDSAISSLVGSGTYTIMRTFYANTRNTISDVNFGKAWLSSSSANLKKAEIYNTQDGIYTLIYTYTLNPQNGISNRVTKMGDSVIESRNYSYY